MFLVGSFGVLGVGNVAFKDSKISHHTLNKVVFDYFLTKNLYNTVTSNTKASTITNALTTTFHFVAFATTNNIAKI